jgi:hypothetical protein
MNSQSEVIHEPILPFYSENTLGQLHRHVRDLDRGLAVYIRDDRSFATIGTRGIRPRDGTPGLIVHVSVRLEDEDPDRAIPKIILRHPVHNLEHTPAAPDELRRLLIGTLAGSGFLPPGAESAASDWDFF